MPKPTGAYFYAKKQVWGVFRKFARKPPYFNGEMKGEKIQSNSFECTVCTYKELFLERHRSYATA